MQKECLVSSEHLPPSLHRGTVWRLSNSQTSNRQYTPIKHPFNGPFPGLHRKVKPVWILLKQEIVSGSGISWTICKSARLRTFEAALYKFAHYITLHCSRQITTPVPDHSAFYRPNALPADQPTASKHWRHTTTDRKSKYLDCLTVYHSESAADPHLQCTIHTWLSYVSLHE